MQAYTGRAEGPRRARHRHAMGYRRLVIPSEAVAAAYAQWITPALPLYGNDHERADFAP